MDQTNRRTLSIEVLDTGVLHFGQHLYVVAAWKQNHISVSCPICDDTRKVTIRGVEFPCPNCVSQNKTLPVALTLSNFVVVEYILNQLYISGDKTKRLYNGGYVDDKDLPRVLYKGFYKIQSNAYTANFSASDVLQSEADYQNKADRITNPESRVPRVFREKSWAKAVAKELHLRQKEMLAEFNAQHGTNHKYPFEF